MIKYVTIGNHIKMKNASKYSAKMKHLIMKMLRKVVHNWIVLRL